MSSLSLGADKEFEVFAYRLVLTALWLTVVGCVSGGHKGKSDLAETSESHDVSDASADNEVVNTDVSFEDSSDGTFSTDILEDTGEGEVSPPEEIVEVDVAAEDISDAASPEPPPNTSAGCSVPGALGKGLMQLSHTFSEKAGGERSFYLSVPNSYDPTVPQRLMVGFAGTNWLGSQIRSYLGLEKGPKVEGEIYVYPDLEWHDFPSWGNLGGWLLGPHAGPAKGMEDIEFTRELIQLLSEEYCIDMDRIFATGHSWGGDMAAVVGCFLGDIFRAVAPAAANQPYWFDAPSGQVGCVSYAAVWTFFGQNETHFTSQAYPGEYGDQQVAFWKNHHSCGQGENVLEVGNGECVEYPECTHVTRYCFYEPGAGHGAPSYFSAAVRDWFRSF